MWSRRRSCDLARKCLLQQVDTANKDNALYDEEVACESCERSLHLACARFACAGDVWDVDRFYCAKCERTTGPSTLHRTPSNEHRNNPFESNANDKPMQVGTPRFLAWLSQTRFAPTESVVRSVHANELTYRRLIRDGFDSPIIVRRAVESLGCRMPEQDSLPCLADVIGLEKCVDVFDSRRQQTRNMPLHELRRFFSNKEARVREQRRNSTHIYSCTNYDISHTPLANDVTAPRAVRELSWLGKGADAILPSDYQSLWPKNYHEHSNKFLSVSVRGSYADFRQHKSGTSCWYHVVRGELTFFLLKPSSHTVEQFRQWKQLTAARRTELRSHLLRHVETQEIGCLQLQRGDTLLLPSGCIHAVLTNDDALLFGGRFLHSLSVECQLRALEVERSLRDNLGRQPREALLGFAIARLARRLHQCASSSSSHELRACERLVDYVAIRPNDYCGEFGVQAAPLLRPMPIACRELRFPPVDPVAFGEKGKTIDWLTLVMAACQVIAAAKANVSLLLSPDEAGTACADERAATDKRATPTIDLNVPPFLHNSLSAKSLARIKQEPCDPIIEKRVRPLDSRERKESSRHHHTKQHRNGGTGSYKRSNHLHDSVKRSTVTSNLARKLDKSLQLPPLRDDGRPRQASERRSQKRSDALFSGGPAESVKWGGANGRRRRQAITKRNGGPFCWRLLREEGRFLNDYGRRNYGPVRRLAT